MTGGSRRAFLGSPGLRAARPQVRGAVGSTHSASGVKRVIPLRLAGAGASRPPAVSNLRALGWGRSRAVGTGSDSPGRCSRPRSPRGRLRPQGAPAPPTWPRHPTHQRARPWLPHPAPGAAATAAALPGRGVQGTPRRRRCCRRRGCCIPGE